MPRWTIGVVRVATRPSLLRLNVLWLQRLETVEGWQQTIGDKKLAQNIPNWQDAQKSSFNSTVLV